MLSGADGIPKIAPNLVANPILYFTRFGKKSATNGEPAAH
jgi:hypothetical protein